MFDGQTPPKATKESDIYAFGLLILHMALGRKELWPSDMSKMEVYLKCIANNTVLDKLGVNNDWILLPIIKECLKKNPSDRPSALKVRQMLKKMSDNINNGAKVLLNHQLRIQLFDESNDRQRYYEPNYVTNERSQSHISSDTEEKSYSDIITSVNEFINSGRDNRILCIFGDGGTGIYHLLLLYYYYY